MGAMKNLAIEAEQAEFAAGDPHAFRQGMIYAVNRVLASRAPAIGDFSPEGRALWRATSNIIDEVMDTIYYLQGLDQDTWGD